MDELSHRLIMGSFPALESWLCADIGAQQRQQGGRQVTLLMGSGLAGRRLDLRFEREGVDLDHVRRQTLDTFAGRLASTGRDTLPVLPLGGGEVLLRDLARYAPADGYFTPILDRPGLRSAVLRTLDELALAGLDQHTAADALAAAVQDLGDDPARLADLGRLFVAYRRALAGRYADRAARLRGAIAAVEAGARLPDQLYVHAVLDLAPLERRLLTTCAARTALTALLPHDGGVACRRLDGLRDFFIGLGCRTLALPSDDDGSDLALVRRAWSEPGTAPAQAVAGTSADSETEVAEPTVSVPEGGLEINQSENQQAEAPRFGILAAPGESREVREAVREVMRAAREGVPPHEIALLFRDGATYRPLAHEILTGAGIPHYLAGGRPLGETVAGRAALALLRLAAGKRTRAEVMELLLTAPLRWEALLPAGDGDVALVVQPTAWDRLSREAGITGGAAQWHERLERLRTALAGRLPVRDVDEDGDADAGEDAQRPSFARIRADIAHLDTLRAVVASLLKRLDTMLRPRPWAAALAHIDELLGDLLAPSDELDLVRDALRGLTGLAELEPGEDPMAVLHAAEQAIHAGWQDIGRFGGDVFVGDLTNARALAFRVVIVLGAGERVFPAPPPRDPILDNRERAALDRLHDLGLTVATGYEELLFQHVLTAATERLVLCYPCMDGEGRERFPSHFLLRAGEALLGRPVDPSGIARVPGYRRLRAARIAPDDPDDALTPLEYDLAEMYRALDAARATDGSQASPCLGYLDQIAPQFALQRRMVMARLGRRSFGPYNGVFEDDGARTQVARRYGLGGRPLAPTEIEQYATCPQRYFLSRVLRIAPVEEPEEVRRLRPNDRGTLIHAVLERFYRALHADGLLPLTANQLDLYQDRLHTAAREEFDRACDAGLTGLSLLWELDQATILEDLDEWLRLEVEDSEASAMAPVRLESAFGTGPDAATPPVRYDLGDGLSVSFRGRIDRVDRSADGSRFRVVDYKSGRLRGDKPDRLQGGRTMQLPVYLLAGAALAGVAPDASGSAEYAYVSRRASYERVQFTQEALHGRRDGLDQVLRTVAGGVADGRFFPHPGKGGKNCTYCAYAPVCDGRVADLFERNRADPAAAQFLALEAIE
jgi:ATP-dependent helicase/nuclease subunit B